LPRRIGGGRLENPVHPRPIPAAIPTFSRATSTWEMGINIGDLFHRALLARAARGPPNTCADRPRRPPGWHALVGHHRHRHHPSDLLLFAEPEAIACAAAFSHRACYLDCWAAIPAAASLLGFTLIAGCRAASNAQALPAKLKPALDAVEKAGKQTSRTPSLTPGCSGARAIQGRVVGALLQLLPDQLGLRLHPYMGLQRIIRSQGEAPLSAPYAAKADQPLEELIASANVLAPERESLREAPKKLWAATTPPHRGRTERRKPRDLRKELPRPFNQTPPKDLEKPGPCWPHAHR